MIRRRAGWWQVRVYAGLDPVTGQRRYRYAHTESEQEAPTVEARLKAEARGVRIDPGRNRTLGLLLSRWLAWVEELEVVAPSTLVSYRRWAERVVAPTLGRVPVARVDVACWRAGSRPSGGLVGGVEGRRRPGACTTCTRCWWRRWTGRWRGGWCATNPAQLVRLPPVEQPEVAPPSAGQLARLMAAAWAADPLFGLFVRLAAVVGARGGSCARCAGAMSTSLALS